MKIRLHPYIFIFILFNAGPVFAQSVQPRFNLITGSNGISLGKINCITRDRQGVTWFSDQDNHSIIRYDGTHMTKFQYDPKNPNSLGGSYPECLYADSSGIIWIGFNGMGLDRFDPETNHFTHFRHETNDPESLANNIVYAILVDHFGNIWAGTKGGLDLLDQKSGKFKHYYYDERDSTSLSYNEVRSIYEDHEGRLWVGTANQWENTNSGGLNLLNRETGKFTRYMNSPKDPHSLINNKVRAIFEDSKGTFWVGTAGDGLHTMDRQTGIFERHTYNPAKPELLSRPPVKGVFDHITFITEDAVGDIWIGTLLNGLGRYDTLTKRVTHYGNNADGSGTFKDNSGWWANASKDGLIWISTQQSHLYRIDIFTNNIPHFESGYGVVNAIYQESPDALWIGTNAGLIRKDIVHGISHRFVNEPLDPNSARKNVVTNIINDKEGGFLLSTLGGVSRFNPVTGLFTRVQLNQNINLSINNNFVNATCVDGELNLWIGTTGTLDMVDLKTGKSIRYSNDPNDSNSLSSAPLVFILAEEKDKLWVGTYYSGLDRLNRQTGKFKHYLSGANTTCIYKDIGGTIWVGTGNGLFYYDKKSDDFLIFREANIGIRIDNVSSVIGDDQDNLWIASSSGIFRINQKRDQIIRYDSKNGIDPEYLIGQTSSHKGQDGEIFFGTSFGYYGFHPDQLKILTSAAKIDFTDFWLKGVLIKPAPGEPLTEPVSSSREIHLTHDQNAFSIGFTALDYGDQGDKTFYYKLDNYDEDWRPSGNEERAYYYNVPPGKYTFRIKTANSINGAWAEKNISINIALPWWSTWWAYTLYGLIFIVLTYSIHRFQKNRLIIAEREKTRERELTQAKEIEKAYGELKTTQSQLIQSEKMASLGELTAGIAHEIQNPLNFVNNFSEVNKELIDETSQAIRAGNTNEAIELLSSLRDNEEKISNHGQRADSIVKGMLQHSRISAGQKEPTDINALADEYLRLSYHGLRAKDKSFDVAMQTDFDPIIGKINIVPQDVGRVMLNLYNNAFYAVSEKAKRQTHDYEPRVSVSTKRIGAKIKIMVKDNGTGIPQKVIDKIFQPFFTTKPTGQGTGLGLSMSYDIIKTHGGELKVDSKEGEGAEFVVLIPIV